jgi:hypothetical protein
MVAPHLPPGWEQPVAHLRHFVFGGGDPVEWHDREVLEAALNGFLRALKEGRFSLDATEGRWVTGYGDYPAEVTFIPLEGWGHLDKLSPAMAVVGGFTCTFSHVPGTNTWSCRLVDRYDWDDVINQRVPSCLVPWVERLPARLLDQWQVFHDGTCWKFRRDWNRFGTPFETRASFTITHEGGEWWVSSDKYPDPIPVNPPVGVYTRYYPALQARAQRAKARALGLEE